MFRIGICDDEKTQIEYLEELCGRYFQEIEQECEFIRFLSGEEVLAYAGEKFQLLFLDIELKDMDGIQVLKRMEEMDVVWRIVFVSSHTESVFYTFGLKTLDFGVKPVTYAQVKRWISIAMREYDENVIIKCHTLNGKKWIRLEEICYLEAEGNYTYIVGKYNRQLVTGNLKAWEMQLSERAVIRIHKSYLLNLNFLNGIERDWAQLLNGVKLPIGRQYKKAFQEAYKNFIKSRVRGRV